MKNLLITMALCLATFTINAQDLSDAELAAVNNENITAMEQMRLNSENTFKNRGVYTTVGGTGCSYTNIQDAIDDNHAEIRITSGVYKENIVISNKNVEISGGYSSCADANNNNYDEGVIAYIVPNIGSGEPVMKISGNNVRYYVVLQNLYMSGGEVLGGLAISDADLGLSINTVELQGNASSNGGGLSVSFGSTDIYAQDLSIRGNQASDNGGGLYCRGSNNTIMIDSNESYSSAISGNTAFKGGGAYISGCTFTNYSGDQNSPTSGISYNEAESDGGGIYALNSAKVFLNGNRYCATSNTCYGNNDKPVNLTGNIADSDQNNVGGGGAIYANGTNTAVYGNNLKVNLNKANSGSAVYLLNGALFQTQTTYDNGPHGNTNHCWSKGKCNQFTGNSPITNNQGSVFSVFGGQLKMNRTHIEENQTLMGFIFYIANNTSAFDLEGSYVVGNGTNSTNGKTSPIGISNGASARIAYSTIADNNARNEIISHRDSHLKIYSSIIHDLSGVMALWESNPISTDTDCLIVNKLGYISDPRSIVADPQFVDRNNNDYHLNAALSPAVDYCDDSLAQHTTRDTDREERGWNDGTINNIYGPFDVGADESYGNDVIFEDGFDGGDLIFKDGFE